jgi:hypothetical protein
MAARVEKRRKKEWIEVEFNNPNMELNVEDPCWFDYSFLASEEGTDEE